MSGFWAQKLGQQAAPAAPPAPVQPASTRPWWMPAQVQQQAPAAPQQVVVQQAPQQQQTGEVPIEILLSQENYTTTKAASARDSERCPDCNSGNYMRSAQSPNSMKQCFDCGYNERFLHTTHGASGIGQKNLPVKTARVQTLSENNFNPQQVIGRVG